MGCSRKRAKRSVPSGSRAVPGVDEAGAEGARERADARGVRGADDGADSRRARRSGARGDRARRAARQKAKRRRTGGGAGGVGGVLELDRRGGLRRRRGTASEARRLGAGVGSSQARAASTRGETAGAGGEAGDAGGEDRERGVLVGRVVKRSRTRAGGARGGFSRRARWWTRTRTEARGGPRGRGGGKRRTSGEAGMRSRVARNRPAPDVIRAHVGIDLSLPGGGAHPLATALSSRSIIANPCPPPIEQSC